MPGLEAGPLLVSVAGVGTGVLSGDQLATPFLLGAPMPCSFVPTFLF